MRMLKTSLSRLVRAPQVDRQWLAFAEIADELKRLRANSKAIIATVEMKTARL
jgi:hypothetical protein